MEKILNNLGKQYKGLILAKLSFLHNKELEKLERKRYLAIDTLNIDREIGLSNSLYQWLNEKIKGR